MRTQVRAAFRRAAAVRKDSSSKIPRPGPEKWNRPLAPGVLTAYDEALKVIRKDSHRLKEEVALMRSKIAEAESRGDEESSMTKLRKKLGILEVQSEVNLPEVRWEVANGKVDMSRAVHRHLVEQKWREDGDLDLLMERIHQMNVVPDVMSTIHPSVDLRVTFPTPPPKSLEIRENTKRWNKPVEPGVFLVPEQTRKEPHLYATVFHPETHLYTLIMLDPDVPDQAKEGFQTLLHWLQPNIPLSATGPQRIQFSELSTPYVPPHPQRGTPYHRYVLLLLPQPSSGHPLPIPAFSPRERLGFDLRSFMEQFGLDGAKGGGAHIWREVWNEDVSAIYKDVMNISEPVYGRPRKRDPYAEVKRLKRYV